MSPGSDNFDGIAERDPSGRYIRYHEILGRGAFKTVYKAFDEVEGIEVAWNQVLIKNVMGSSQQLELLYSEIHILKSLKHANIMKFYHWWVDDRCMTINIITELFTSGNLKQYREKHKQVNIKAIKNWARQILRGLQYLHTQNPRIIHRDLKCENIFVNGHTGQVKIGDLGLATVMQQPAALSVIGTPEFIAPELFREEECNELVDIYSFGVCMLEMATNKSSYLECHGVHEIYDKVIRGEKPASLDTIMNLEMKEFIEKCLVSASTRPSAEELLNDPFLVSDNLPGQIPLTTPKMLESAYVSGPKSQSMDIDLDSKKSNSSTSMKSICEIPRRLSLTLLYNDVKTFKLIGKVKDEERIKMKLLYIDSKGYRNSVKFPFYPKTDTIVSVLCEMIEQISDLSGEDLVPIVQLMEQLIPELKPDYKPPCDFSLAEYISSLEDSSASNCILDALRYLLESGMCKTSTEVIGIGDDRCARDSLVSGISVEHNLVNQNHDSGLSACDCSEVSCSAASDGLSLSSLSSITPTEKDTYSEDLKQELDAIDSHYNKCLRELSRKREEAIEFAKKRHASGKGLVS
ncbi:unnamed protein product [Amaranthus hypochondriacus]